MTIDRERLDGALDKLRVRKPLRPESIRKVNDLCEDLDRSGEEAATVALALLGGSLAALSQTMAKDEIEEIVLAMLAAMYGDVDDDQRKQMHDIQERSRQMVSEATGIAAAKLARLPFERS